MKQPNMCDSSPREREKEQSGGNHGQECSKTNTISNHRLIKKQCKGKLSNYERARTLKKRKNLKSSQVVELDTHIHTCPDQQEGMKTDREDD